MKGLINNFYTAGNQIVKNILIAVVLILLLVVPGISVSGVSTTLTATYCESQLNGNWSVNSCTIPDGSNGVIPAGDTLSVLTGTAIIVNGTLTVNGTLELGGGSIGTNSSGTIINNNVINHRTTGEGLKNYGTFNNNGSLSVAYGALLGNYHIFTNAGSLIVYGELDNLATTTEYDSFTNTGTVNISKSGSNPGGYFFAAVYTSNTNQGTLTISAESRMSVRGSLTNHGSLTNKGTFSANSLTNSGTGTLYNDLYADWTCFDNNSSLINEGSFTNRYYLTLKDACIFTNKSSGSFLNTGITYVGQIKAEFPWDQSLGGSLVNEGSVDNRSSIILANNSWSEILNDNGAEITNSDAYSVLEVGVGSRVYNTGLIEHKRGVIRPGGLSFPNYTTGYIYNYSKTNSTDYGTLNKYCAGSITLDYAYINPDPVNMCTGTIIIRKDTVPNDPTDFSFTGGLGTFLLDDDADPTLPNERTFSGLTPGSYSVTEATAAGFSLTSLVCTSTESGNTTTVDKPNRTANINLRGDINETVTCTFTNTADCTPPEVTTHPTNVVITYGQNASFTVAGTDYSSVQWQVNSGSGWSNISGATTLTYNLTKPAVSLSGNQYQAVLTGCGSPATSNAATLTVNQAPVTASITALDKVYDGTTSATVTGCTLNGVVSGDSVTCNYASASASFADKNVGTGKTVMATGLTLSGADAGNYSFAGTGSGTANIKAMSITGRFTASGKVYDGTTAATVLTRSLSVAVSGDDVNLTGGSAAFSDKHVGTGKTVTLTGASLSGADAGNYVLDSVVTAKANITVRNVTVRPVSGQFKVYGTADPTLTYTVDVPGLAAGDSFTGALSRDMGEDVGLYEITNYAITTHYLAIDDGNSGQNYLMSLQINVEFEILPKPITGSFTVNNKVYDGTTAATVVTRNLSGVLSGDTVSLTGGSAAFSDTHVGTGKTVTLTDASLSGTNAGNYVLDSVGATTADITPAPVTATAGNYSGMYNGAAHSPSACSVTGTFKGDLSCTNDPVSVGPNVGSGVIAPVVNGTGLTNYAITSVNGSWSITPALVTATAGNYSGTYDGKSHSPMDCAVTGVYKGELSCRNDPTSVGPDVGTGVIAPVVDGTVLSNYEITNVNGSWTIKPAPVTVKAGSYTGTYDGAAHSLTDCAVTGTYTGDLSCTNDPASVGPDVGSGTILPVIDGTGLSNFYFASMNGSWSITKATPTCLISGYTGVYDDDPHGASGSCTGVKAETLTTLDLGATFTDVPGGTANWTFTDTSGNYNGDSGTVEIVISKATSTCAINGYTGVYDGDPHGASGSCAGVKAETLTTLDLGGIFTNVPGGIANWAFADTSGNYNDDSGSVDIVITKAATTSTVTCPADVIYNGLAQTPCEAEVTGPGGLVESLTVTYENNINPGTATASASYEGGANWLPSSDSKTFTIIYMGESQLTTARTKCAVYAAGDAFDQPKLLYTLSIDKKTGAASIKSTTPSTFLYYVKAVLPDTASTLVITQENLVGFPGMGAAVTLYDENCAKLSPLAATVSIVDGNITIEFAPGLAERIVYAAVSYTARTLRGQVVSGPPYPDIDYTFKAALDGTIFSNADLYLEWKVD